MTPEIRAMQIKDSLDLTLEHLEAEREDLEGSLMAAYRNVIDRHGLGAEVDAEFLRLRRSND